MPNCRTSVQAEKAGRYFNTLCKHFARKVTVDVEESSGKVHFPMGLCTIEVQGTELSFLCEAENSQALEQVKEIIVSHVTGLGELRQTHINWSEIHP